MKSVKPWVSGMGVDDASAEAWLRELPKNESFTFWCLSTGKLNTEKYLNWAREHYGLAVLQTGFFAQTPNANLWATIQSVANWSEKMIPVQEWDGVIFIACVEPLSDVQWSFPVQYVLASAANLKTYWVNLQNAKPTVVAALPPPVVVAPSRVPVAPPAEVIAESPAAPIETPEPQSATAPPPMPASVAPPLPFPIKPAMSIDSILSPSGGTPNGLEISVVGTMPAIPEIPEISAASDLNDVPAAVDEPQGLSLTLTNIQTPSAGSMDVMEELQRKMSAESASAPDLNAPENLAWKNPSGGLDTSALNMPEGMGPTHISNPEPAAVAEPTATSTAADVLIFKPKSQETPQPDTGGVGELTTSGADYVGFLSQLKNHFPGGMILWVTNDQIKPLCWDEAFRPKDGNAEKLWTLNQPSAFRIAYRTRMPYLGHLVETPINQEFFQAWGFAEFPKSVLIQPVAANGKTTYLLLAILDGTKKNHQVLSSGEKLAHILAGMKYQPKAA